MLLYIGILSSHILPIYFETYRYLSQKVQMRAFSLCKM